MTPENPSRITPVIVTMKEKSKPTALEEWCATYCPTLPTRIESVVAEWNLTQGGADKARDLILEHVRQSVST